MSEANFTGHLVYAAAVDGAWVSDGGPKTTSVSTNRWEGHAILVAVVPQEAYVLQELESLFQAYRMRGFFVFAFPLAGSWDVSQSPAPSVTYPLVEDTSGQVLPAWFKAQPKEITLALFDEFGEQVETWNTLSAIASDSFAEEIEEVLPA